jgi:hypothetical protein
MLNMRCVMRRSIRTAGRGLAAGLALMAFASCAGYEPLWDILDGGMGPGRQITGEIRSIDTRRGELRIDTGWSGSERIRYDGRTVFQGRSGRSSVSSLDRGDLVRIQVDQTRSRELYARRIQLVESARRGPGPGAPVVRLERVDGSVANIDHRRGTMNIRRNRAGTIQVVLPANPSRSLLDRFNRVRKGQNIRVEGYFINGSRMELRQIL